MTAALRAVAEDAAGLDVLVHDAGVLETARDGAAALRSSGTNAVGIVRVTEAALPLLRRSASPAVVTVSSSMGSSRAVTTSGRPGSQLPLALYAASEAAATMLTVQYAEAEPSVRSTAVEPGATATDMTAASGTGRTVQESAAVVVRVVQEGSDGPSGTLRDEHGVLRW